MDTGLGWRDSLVSETSSLKTGSPVQILPRVLRPGCRPGPGPHAHSWGAGLPVLWASPGKGWGDMVKAAALVGWVLGQCVIASHVGLQQAELQLWDCCPRAHGRGVAEG